MSLIVSSQISATKVINKIKCIENHLGDKDFVITTDYPKFKGGEESSSTPWHTFLASYASCQIMDLTDYCIEHDIDYREATLEIEVFSKEDEYSEIEGLKRFLPGKHLSEIKVIINFPKGFTEIMKEEVVMNMKQCKISELIFNENKKLKLNIIEKKGEENYNHS